MIEPSQFIVETRSLTKRFGDFTALNECSLLIERGQVFGLLGPNGAGKSTLIRLLLGFLNPTSGSAMVGGVDCTHHVEVHRMVSYLPGDARLYRMMRGRSVLKLFCSFRADSNFKRALGIAERLELDLSRWVGLMSTGMRQKLALAICLSNEAELLILDEPTANLDPTVRGQVMEMVMEAKRSGKSVVFSSHVLSEIEETCDSVAILRKGSLVHEASISELKRQHRITANLVGQLPDLPVELQASVRVKQTGQKVQIETHDELSAVLRWLGSAPLQDVFVQPVGLRSVYDRFHHADRIVSHAEVSVGEASERAI